MKLFQNLLFLVALTLIFSFCKNDDVASSGEWLIPSDEVFDGGPGKDGIPSVDNPQFAISADINYMQDDDLILGIQVGDEVRGYTHPVLDWHEIINDEINGVPVAITYCPLTGTGIGWDRTINGSATTFGVSGLLYNSNLIPYDRNSDSNWSQMANECVNGILINTPINTRLLVEMPWKTWKEIYPDAKVTTTSTGISRNYGTYPYGNYRTSNNLNFPVDIDDDRLHKKERVLGVIINGSAVAYQFEKFEGDELKLVEDNFQGTELVIIGSEGQNFLVAFERALDGELLDFNVLQNELPAIIEDQNGNKYDVFGKRVEGTDLGKILNTPTNYIGYWFSWGAFYPNTEIFE